MSLRPAFVIGATVAAASLLAGCLSPQHGLEPDFGRATRNNIAAQVADPEPRYARKVEPAANGVRSVTASQRYERGQVTPPVVQSTSSVAAGNK
jgi:outer membrane murein-binding lipoprotein Lpp